MFESNTQNFKSKMAGFSLPGVLVGVALIGISATIISQTVINSRQTQKTAELKLSSNKFQQAALDAVTERVKEFVLEKCSGARWGGAGSEVEKAFSEFQLTTDAGEMTKLKFTKTPDLLSGNDEVKRRCREPVGPGTLGSGQFMRFCMEITPTGSPQIDYRLLELLIVPINLASDQAINCSEARGAAAGVKVTWQMFNQIDMAKVSGTGDNKTVLKESNKTVLKESGVFLVSAETESYNETCSITATRVGTSNQCNINVDGLGRRPPTLFKNGAVVTDFSWARGASANYDEFTATTTCETNQTILFRAQSAAGSDFCDATAVQPSLSYVTSTYKKYHNPDWVKCIFRLQFTVNGGTTWHTFSGNRHWSTRTVRTEIKPEMGFQEGQCNVLRPRLQWVPGGSLTCATYYPPNWANKGNAISYLGGGTYSVLIWDQYKGLDPGIFSNINITSYPYRIEGYGNGSCL